MAPAVPGRQEVTALRVEGKALWSAGWDGLVRRLGRSVGCKVEAGLRLGCVQGGVLGGVLVGVLGGRSLATLLLRGAWFCLILFRFVLFGLVWFGLVMFGLVSLCMCHY